MSNDFDVRLKKYGIIKCNVDYEFLKEYYNWILKAKIQDAHISVNKNNKGNDVFREGIKWYDGIWMDGEWHDGTWFKGIWENGTWHDGEWFGGLWIDGIWKNGIWHDGTFARGKWHNGIWNNGIWDFGEWLGGVWANGDVQINIPPTKELIDYVKGYRKFKLFEVNNEKLY